MTDTPPEPEPHPAASPLPQASPHPQPATSAEPNTAPASPDLLAIARQFMRALPHAQALGLELEEIGDGVAVISMPWDPKLIGDPATGVIHGGAVSTLMDTASGSAVMSHPAGPPMTATLDLRIDYMRPATPGQRVRARAECHHVTRSIAFIRVVATDEDESRPVAMGTGAFTVDLKLSPRKPAPTAALARDPSVPQ